MKQNHQKNNHKGKYIIIAIFFIIIFIFAYKPIIKIINIELAKSWPFIYGRIEKVDLRISWLYFLNENSDDRDYNAYITYSYNVNNQKYTNCDEIDGPYIVEHRLKQEEEILNEFRNKYQIGTNLKIYYNPNNNQNSFILDDSKPYVYLIIAISIIGLIILIISIPIMIARIKK